MALSNPDFYIRNADTMAPAMHRLLCNQLRFFPYHREVILFMELEESLEGNAILEEQVESLIEERDNLRARLSAFGVEDGFLTLDQIDGGDALREINDRLQEMAHDIHKRGHVDKPRKIVATIIGEPGKESARVDLDYEVEIKKPKCAGSGVGYLDAKGNLVPAYRDAEQYMLPVKGEENKAAA